MKCLKIIQLTVNFISFSYLVRIHIILYQKIEIANLFDLKNTFENAPNIAASQYNKLYLELLESQILAVNLISQTISASLMVIALNLMINAYEFQVSLRKKVSG